MNIGENIKKYRKIKGITQVELAKIINKSESSIRKYEGNIVTPDFPTLDDISEALGCNLFDLTMDTEKLQKDVKIIESADHIIELAKKCGITMIDEYDNDGDGEYLRYVHISFSDKEFRLRGTEFYKLSERVLDSIITNVLAAENYDLLK